jgi:hypothetical protein
MLLNSRERNLLAARCVCWHYQIKSLAHQCKGQWISDSDLETSKLSYWSVRCSDPSAIIKCASRV